eukprot:Lithocolla_globosa_v1_NODE_3229_length_1726_cov_57.410533.p3 type:complete len:169 gc:universal NODE_3229_length_1726_cov_57.410533:612-1118(+)
MQEQLVNFFHENKFFTSSQYGFLKNLNTNTALSDFFENLLHQLDQGMVGLGTLVDLAKAFDTVNHNILLEKLDLYGVGGKALQLIKSYLSQRSQIVIIDGIESDSMDITCGVPQGSILGPLFFIIYINDLPQALKHSSPLMFADDTCTYMCNFVNSTFRYFSPSRKYH